MSRLSLVLADPEELYCLACAGEGHVPNADDQPITCPACGGKGLPPHLSTEDWDDEPGFPLTTPKDH